MQQRFVHLNIHTEFSLADSTVRCKTLAKRCQEFGMPALAVTDLVNTYAAIKHYRSSIAHGLKPIFGAHVWVSDGTDYSNSHELILLVMNKAGFQSLSQLLSHAYLENQHQGKGYINSQLLFRHCENLIVLSGGLNGAVGQKILASQMDQAEQVCALYQKHFKNRFYLEIQRLGHSNEERYIEAVVNLSSRLNIPIVASNAVQFIDQHDFHSHEIRVCISQGRLLEDKRRRHLFTREQYFKSPAQMCALFADIPEAIENTVEIAKRCNFRFQLNEVHMPCFDIKSGKTADQQLSEDAQQGLLQALSLKKYSQLQGAYQQRLTYEINIIIQMGFASYFLIVADFIAWSKHHDIPVGPGRGSGAGSLVAYGLGITQLDPLQHDLLFERFLNPERVSMPDFDVDFCMQGRDRVIEYVANKYGREKVSQIITYGTMAARAVIRDVGRVMGLGYGHVDKVAKLIPFVPGMTLKVALEQEPELLSLYKNDQQISELIDNAKLLEGLARNVGKHAGGVVIAPTKLSDFSALYAEQGSTQTVTQFDKDDLEAIGLVKFDFLGLKTLTVIDWTLKSINQSPSREGKAQIGVDDFTDQDEKTYSLLNQACTTAVFQLESRGMKDLIKRLKPDAFDDLVALVALYRPGPLESGMVDDYVNRKHGLEKVTYSHPRLEPILKATYGVILYQEQVMQIAQVLAGYSLGAADILRKAMGKKKPEEMAKQRDIFVSGAQANKIDSQTAESIFNLMEKFAGYGFNKSHSAAYALISYQTAWLKANFTAHFIASALSVDMDSTDKVVILIAEARELGLTISPPNVNQSEYRFLAYDKKTILYGLGAIKGLGKPIIEGIVLGRKNTGKYADLFELCCQIKGAKLNRRALEALAHSGAMDCFGEHRSTLMASINRALEAANQQHDNLLAGQSDLFGVTQKQGDQISYIRVPQWRDIERLKLEKSTLGLYLSGHPVDQYREELDKFISARLIDLKPTPANQVVAGLVVGVRTMLNRRGDKFAFVTLDDNTARLEVSVFTELYKECSEILRHDKVLVVGGQLSIDERTQGLQMRAQAIYNLSEFRCRAANALVIQLNQVQLRESQRELIRIIKTAHRGRLPIILNYSQRNYQLQLKLGDEFRIKPDDSLISALERLYGDTSIALNYP